MSDKFNARIDRMEAEIEDIRRVISSMLETLIALTKKLGGR
jgi:hypothetical protein